MIRVEYFCTRCNASAQRRDPGDEVNTGYHAVTYHSAPEAKRDSAVHPADWRLDPTGRLVCDACRPATLRAHAGTVLPESPPGARRDAPVSPTGWPSRATPFDAH